jgi:hypothetical protein
VPTGRWKYECVSIGEGVGSPRFDPAEKEVRGTAGKTFPPENILIACCFVRPKWDMCRFSFLLVGSKVVEVKDLEEIDVMRLSFI